MRCNRLTQAHVEQRAVRQSGQPVLIREMQNLRFACGDAFEHVLEARGKRADLLASLHAHPSRIVAIANPPGEGRQHQQRLSNAAREHDAAHDRGYDAGERQQYEHRFQLLEGFEAFSHRALQGDANRVPAFLADRCERRVEASRAERTSARSGDFRQLGDHVDRIHAQMGAGEELPPAVHLRCEERDVQRRERAQIGEKALVDEETHGHPGDWIGRQHRHDHDLIGAAVALHDCGSSAFALRHPDQLRMRELALTRHGPHRVGDDVTIGRDQQDDVGPHSCTVIVQHRGDGGRIPCGHRIAEREILGDHLSGLQEALAVLVHQAQEDPRTHLQLLRVAVVRDARADALDEHENGGLHHGEQKGEYDHHAAAQAAERQCREGRHGCRCAVGVRMICNTRALVPAGAGFVLRIAPTKAKTGPLAASPAAL